ncbi:sec-independent protein translocase protein TatC [bacterium BMS3Abin05]|nr:sec-independent protein translocase protein TatC [bacterium BMS3Abin05]GBE27049.1 sec-independent protein translocase protein TatC [bacterium BMS3Bbin03]HDK35748.1 twin-arginine translocase subunit TatC [Bacteroidota bacterium]HDL78973.1 twin-arginine translocase subunit TatC [Bacteroidota bacterium]
MNFKKKKKSSATNSNEMPFLAHLEELRWRILKSIIAVFVMVLIAFPFSKQLLEILTYPNNRILNPPKLIFLHPTGMLMVRFGIAIAAGIILALPVLFYQFWQFVTPGLLPKEKKFVWPVIAFSTLCFLLGIVFAYFVMLPFILPFLYSLGTEAITPTININDYIGFISRIIMVSGIIFELPALSYFLTRVGILKPYYLKKYRRYAIVIVFILAAILTPPDPGSQILMALPLLLLYEISIWISVFVYRRKAKKEVSQKA